MNRTEAEKIIQVEIELFRLKPYEALVEMIDKEPTTGERTGSSGKKYQIEIQVFFDDKRSGNVRVIVAVDDGRKSSLRPLVDDFIKSPSNEFVGE